MRQFQLQSETLKDLLTEGSIIEGREITYGLKKDERIINIECGGVGYIVITTAMEDEFPQSFESSTVKKKEVTNAEARG